MDNDHKVTLREYVERIFSERQAALDLAFRSQQEALALAARTVELRLEKLNELREEVTRDRGQFVTLREYVERIFSERQAALDLAFRSQQEALALAARTVELRLEKLNELREEVTRDRGQFVTHIQYDVERDDFRRWRDRMDGGINVVRLLSIGGGAALAIEIARAVGWVK